MQPRFGLAQFRTCFCVASLFLTCIDAERVAAQAMKLTDVTDTGGDIVSFLQSGDYAVAVDRPNSNKVSRILSVAIDGSTAPVILNDPSVPVAGRLAIQSYKLKPDDPGDVIFYGTDTAAPSSGFVHFQASIAAPTLPVELTDVERRIYFDARTLEPDYSYEYVVRDDENGIAQIYRTPLLGSGGDVLLTDHANTSVSVQTPVLISATGRLLYHASAHSPTVFELYSVPTNGSGPPVRLNPPIASTADVTSSQLTADGTWTTFRIADSATDSRHLYIVATDGSTSAQRLDQVTDKERVGSWQFTPNEARVLYVTNSSPDSFDGGLYSVSATNPQADHFRVSSSAVNAYSAIYGTYVTDSSERVIYNGFLNSSTSVDLFSASTTQPGTEIQLNTRHAAHGRVSLIRLINGGDRVIYSGDLNTNGFYELYAAETDREGTQIRISGPVASNLGSIFGFQLSPDENWVTYTKTSPSHSAADLFAASTSIADSERTLIRHEMFTRTTARQISSDSTWVVAEVLTLSQNNLRREWLFAIPIDGGVPIRLNDPLPAQGALHDFEFTNSDQGVIYLADAAIREATDTCIPIPGGIGCQPYYGVAELFASQLPETGGLLGDMDGDRKLDPDDVRAFALGILNPRSFAFEFGLPPVNFGDLNFDGFFDQGDIEPFAALFGISAEAILALIPMPGDLNSDGVVDAADYVYWRHNGGSQDDYLAWRANFGNSLVAAGANSIGPANNLASVPESASRVLLTLAVIAVFQIRPPRWPQRTNSLVRLVVGPSRIC